jgi:hypothetical protein
MVSGSNRLGRVAQRVGLPSLLDVGGASYRSRLAGILETWATRIQLYAFGSYRRPSLSVTW